MNCSNKPALKGRLLAPVAAAWLLAMTGACTEVDDRLGQSLLPDNQKMEIEVTSRSSGVNTYLYRKDSLPSSRLGYAWFGQMRDPAGVFGARSNSVLVQFLPYSRPYSDAEGYGINPIIDSIYIMLAFSDARGDTTRVQRFDVYDVTEGQLALHRDSTYYANFPIGEYRGEKLFDFTHTGRRGVAARLFPTAAGKEYLDSIVHLGWDDYTDDSLFHRKFHGLYITPAGDSPTDAAVYSADLASSGLALYVRNHDTVDVSAIYDTLMTLFTFSDTDETDSYGNITTAWNNVSVNMARFDYTGSMLGALQEQTGNFTDTLPTSPTLPLVYVQPMGGVGTYLRFTDELITDIRNLRYKVNDAGETVGKDIMINQALMRIWLEEDSTPTLDRSVKRLGSYLDPVQRLPIPDYQYHIEASYELAYGGYLNRSNGYYELDITSYVQRLAKEKEGDPGYKYIPPVVYLGPAAYNIFGFGESVLQGTDSDRPVSIRITYTIIEG